MGITYAEMTFKCHSRSSNVVPPYQSKARIRVAMVDSNFRRITHRFRDTTCSNAENHISLPHSYLSLNLKVTLLEFETKFGAMGLPYGKEIKKNYRIPGQHFCRL